MLLILASCLRHSANSRGGDPDAFARDDDLSTDTMTILLKISPDPNALSTSIEVSVLGVFVNSQKSATVPFPLSYP